MKRTFYLIGLIFLLSLTNCSRYGSINITLELKGTGNHDHEVPAHVEIDLPSEFQGVPVDNIIVTLQSGDGLFKGIQGQIIESGNGKYQLWWIIPETKTDKDVKWKATLQKNSDVNPPVFSWEDTPGKHMDLLFNNKKVFRYEYELESEFNKEEYLTAKNRVFYHVYDMEGKDFITNGPEEGVWSHHRGIMIGWRKVKFEDQMVSFWGMEDLTVQKHVSFLKKSAGPVLARVEALIHWNDSTGTTIIEENRKATIYRQSPPVIVMLDFNSTLYSKTGPVTLDGDPEHAGVQFRAHNDVAEELPGSVKPTYYFHDDGIDPRNDYDLPWVGMSYGLRNKTYSVVDMNHPGNPEPSIWSAYRDYARFGPYFKYELDTNDPLTINYRFWISESDMPAKETISSKYEVYRNPPQIKKCL